MRKVRRARGHLPSSLLLAEDVAVQGVTVSPMRPGENEERVRRVSMELDFVILLLLFSYTEEKGLAGYERI